MRKHTIFIYKMKVFCFFNALFLPPEINTKKYFMRKLNYLMILLLLLGSYSCKDELDYEQQGYDDGRPLPGVVQEARSFFEEYAANMTLSDEISGLSPGNFAPEWNKAVVTTDEGNYVCVNVPIVSERTFQGLFYSNYDPVQRPSDESYWSAAGQKLIVVKEPGTGNFGCYILTIIPDEANASTNYDAVNKMYNACDPNTKFSGTVLYTIPGDNDIPVAAGRYRNGERYAAASLWFDTNGGAQQLMEDIKTQLGIREMKAFARTMTKNTIPEIVLINGEWYFTTYHCGQQQTAEEIAQQQQAYAQQIAQQIIREQVYKLIDDLIHDMYVNKIGSKDPINNNGPPNISFDNNYNDYYNYYSCNSIISPGILYALQTATFITENVNIPSIPLPMPYIYQYGDDFANNRATNMAREGAKIRTQSKNTCVPFTYEYANKLFRVTKYGHDANYYIKYFDEFHNIKIKKKGMTPFQVMNNTGFCFTTTKFNGDFKSHITKGHLIMTTIRDPGTTDGGHSILVIGCKKNGDLIYIDPTKTYLQVVAPTFILDDYKIVLTGIND